MRFPIYIIIFLALFIFAMITPDPLETPVPKRAEPTRVAQADLKIPVDMLSKDYKYASNHHLSADSPRSILFPQVLYPPCSSPTLLSTSQASECQDGISSQNFYNAVFMICNSIEELNIRTQSVESKLSKLNTPEMIHLSAQIYHLATEWLVKMGDEGTDIVAVKDKISIAHKRRRTEPVNVYLEEKEGAKKEDTDEAKPITTAEEEHTTAKPLALTKQKEEEGSTPLIQAQAQAQAPALDPDSVRKQSPSSEYLYMGGNYQLIANCEDQKPAVMAAGDV